MQSATNIRLPISDPDYRYPASRNPYWAKNRDIHGLVYSDNQTEELSGQWRQATADAGNYASPEALADRELHVEIGCNAGHVLVEWAAANPAAAFIGIDWKFKAVHRGAEKASKKGLQNLLLFRAHAERIAFMFGPAEIDRLHLFFPDPWPRKSQWKNRFINPARLREIAPLLKPDGVFHIKTDHPGYFEWMEAAIAEVSDCWTVIERSDDLHAAHPNPTSLNIPDVTLFERLFILDGIPIRSLKLKPNCLFSSQP